MYIVDTGHAKDSNVSVLRECQNLNLVRLKSKGKAFFKNSNMDALNDDWSVQKMAQVCSASWIFTA